MGDGGVLVVLTLLGLCGVISGGFPGGSEVKASACNAGDPGLILEFGRSPGEGDGYPCQCSFLGNSVDRGTWWATVHGVTKSNMTLKLTHAL